MSAKAPAGAEKLNPMQSAAAQRRIKIRLLPLQIQDEHPPRKPGINLAKSHPKVN
jgi:hypothetical protein